MGHGAWGDEGEGGDLVDLVDLGEKLLPCLPCPLLMPNAQCPMPNAPSASCINSKSELNFLFNLISLLGACIDR